MPKQFTQDMVNFFVFNTELRTFWLKSVLKYLYLVDIDQQAEEMFSHLVTQISERESITEQFKTENQIGWIRGMNNIKNRVI